MNGFQIECNYISQPRKGRWRGREEKLIRIIISRTAENAL
jgi:hypothetical protein